VGRVALAFVVSAIYVASAWHGSSGAPAPAPSYARWSSAASLPTPRWFLAGATGSDGRIYALGGDSGPTGGQLRTVEAYDSGANTWDASVPPMPTGRSLLAAAAGSDGRIYAIGGEDQLGNPLGTVEAYDPKSATWTCSIGDITCAGAQTLVPMPTPRWGIATAVGLDGRIYVMGGSSDILTNCLNMPTPCVGRTAVEVYDPVGNAWSTVASLPTPRYFFGATSGPDGRIYAIGGANQGRILSSMDVYDPAANAWTTTKLPGTVTPVSRLAVATGVDGQVYALGGTTNCGASSGCTGVNQVAVYNPSAGSWTVNSPFVPPLPTNRWGLMAALGSDGRIYAIGGANSCSGSTCTATGAVEAYTPPVRVFLPLAASGSAGG
jgi:hypothetical protein